MESVTHARPTMQEKSGSAPAEKKPPRMSDSDVESTTSSDELTQPGVRKLEAVSMSWTKTSLIVAYLGWVASVVASLG